MNNLSMTKELEKAIAMMVNDQALAVEMLTGLQTVEAIKQAMLSGDFQRLVCVEGGEQQVVYIPFAKEQELRRRIEELEEFLDRIRPSWKNEINRPSSISFLSQ